MDTIKIVATITRSYESQTGEMDKWFETKTFDIDESIENIYKWILDRTGFKEYKQIFSEVVITIAQ